MSIFAVWSRACLALQANQVKLMWASTGKALLALTSSDSDPANRSYYGDAKLHFLSADGQNDVLIQLKVKCFGACLQLLQAASTAGCLASPSAILCSATCLG